MITLLENRVLEIIQLLDALINTEGVHNYRQIRNLYEKFYDELEVQRKLNRFDRNVFDLIQSITRIYLDGRTPVNKDLDIAILKKMDEIYELRLQLNA